MKRTASHTAGPDAFGVEAAAHYVLRLFVSGSSPRSIRAISNIRKLCEERLGGRYDLEVLDVSEHPSLAKDEQIIAVPTLIRSLPVPLRRFIGDMSRAEHLLLGLDLRPSTQAFPQRQGPDDK
jgi:circadian clock protein KaiB